MQLSADWLRRGVVEHRNQSKDAPPTQNKLMLMLRAHPPVHCNSEKSVDRAFLFGAILPSFAAVRDCASGRAR
jgi:hypothetical protein